MLPIGSRRGGVVGGQGVVALGVAPDDPARPLGRPAGDVGQRLDQLLGVVGRRQAQPVGQLAETDLAVLEGERPGARLVMSTWTSKNSLSHLARPGTTIHSREGSSPTNCTDGYTT